MKPNAFPSGASQIKRHVKGLKNSQFFDIYKADGIIVLVYDDNEHIYETESVYVMRFNDMTFAQWQETIESFMKRVTVA